MAGIILVLAVFLMLWLASPVICGILAYRNNRPVVLWVFLGVLLGPIGLLILIVTNSNIPVQPSLQQSAQPNTTLAGLKDELQSIKMSFNALQNRVMALDARISGMQGVSAAAPAGQPVPEPVKIIPKPAPAEAAPKANVEFDLGRFWLNKIGIIVFTLGIGFFIAYTFRYFGPVAKIAFGYAIAAVLFFFGLRLEKKDKYVNYGRVLLGGAWAIVYFTTYAAYHFDASKIIDNQLLGLCLLGVVAAGIVLHSLKYKSEALSIVALGVAYITATLGDINTFSFYSCILLALATLALVYRMQWLKLIIFGICFTYFTHLFWVIRHIYASFVAAGDMDVQKVYFLTNLGFLFTYWSIFMLGIHLIKNTAKDVSNKLSAANFCNFLFFFFMAYPKLFKLYPDYKFTFMFGLGAVYLAFALVMEMMKKRELSTANMLIGLSLLTLSVPLKLMAFHTSVIWFIELPFLVFVGLAFERKVFRYFSLGLAVVLFFKMLPLDFYMKQVIVIFGKAVPWKEFVSFIGFSSMTVCYLLAKRFKFAKTLSVDSLESGLSHIYSGLAVIYLTIYLWLIVNLKFLTLTLSLEALLAFVLGYLLVDRQLRIYALAILLLVVFRFCFIDHYRYMEDSVKWLIIVLELAVFYAAYFLYKSLNNKKQLTYESGLVKPVFIAASLLFTVAVFRHISYQWVTLALGVEGIVLFAAGFLLRDKIFRLAGFVVFAITLVRVIAVDLAGLHIIYKIVSFIILGLIFLGVSFIYTKANLPKPRE
jgi:uncharacterized membrane protein